MRASGNHEIRRHQKDPDMTPDLVTPNATTRYGELQAVLRLQFRGPEISAPHNAAEHIRFLGANARRHWEFSSIEFWYTTR